MIAMLRHKYPVILIVLVSILSRVPLLFTNALFLDGDECVVALMSKHFLEGKTIPLFFYGQSYGFSFMEVLSIGFFYKLIGISDIAVKMAMICLWSIGIAFFFKTLLQFENNNKWLALLITLLFIFSPSYAIWSMKARGGYITAFTLTSLVILLVFHKKLQNSIWIYFIVGLFITIIYNSQPLWIVGLFPIIGYQLTVKFNVNKILSITCGLLIGSLLFYYFKLSLSDFWSPKVIDWSNFSTNNILLTPYRMYENLSGSYHFRFFIPPNIVTNIFSSVFTAMIIISLITGVTFYILRIKTNPLFYVFSLSVFFTLSYSLVVSYDAPRYLLPLTGYALLMIYFLFESINVKSAINLSIVLLIVLGGLSSYTRKNVSVGNRSSVLSLIDQLKKSDTHSLYCDKGVGQWQIIFYSNESVLARSHYESGRYPEYTRSVDASLSDPDRKVALAGRYYKGIEAELRISRSTDNFYYILENPTKKLLEERGFRFN